MAKAEGESRLLPSFAPDEKSLRDGAFLLRLITILLANVSNLSKYMRPQSICRLCNERMGWNGRARHLKKEHDVKLHSNSDGWQNVGSYFKYDP